MGYDQYATIDSMWARGHTLRANDGPRAAVAGSKKEYFKIQPNKESGARAILRNSHICQWSLLGFGTVTDGFALSLPSPRSLHSEPSRKRSIRYEPSSCGYRDVVSSFLAEYLHRFRFLFVFCFHF